MLHCLSLSNGAAANRAVLIIENNRSAREALEDILHLAGLTVFSAANNREALDLFLARHEQLEFVLLSARRWESDTLALIDRLRGIDPQPKLVLASSYTPYELRQLLAGRGWSAYLQKPFTAADLFHTLGKVLHRQPG
jgi:DNA-binding NtrC family response regulator